MADNGCLVRPRQKTAGATVYLMEELGDARMRCDQLVRYVTEAVRLIENSPHKDHFYEVAGHLLHAVPLTLFKLQKALQAVALAANRIDYEEIKIDLRPEKVEQLERVLEDVRIRQINRQSEPLAMTPQHVAAKLRQIAATTRKFQFPEHEVVTLIAALEAGYETDLDDERAVTATVLEGMADVLDRPGAEPMSKLAEKWIQRVVKDPGALHRHFGIPEGENIPTEKIKSELAKLKGKEDMSPAEKKLQHQLNLALTLRGPKVPPPKGKGKKEAGEDERPSRLQLAAMLRRMLGDVSMRGTMAAQKQALPPGIASDEDKQSRFEEGQPADPTENMSPEDAKKWKAEHAKNKDKFKGAAGSFTKVQVQKLLKQHGIEGKVSGSGSNWEVELPNEKAKDAFFKVLPRGAGVGGYRTGYGGWVLRPGYKVDEVDYNNPSSRHHYAADEWKANGAQVTAAAPTKRDWEKALKEDEDMLRRYEADLKTLQRGGSVPNLTEEGAKGAIEGLKAVIQNKKRLISKLGRYGEGEDADKDNDGAPDNIKSEKAQEEWKANTEKNKGKFKGKDASVMEGFQPDPEWVAGSNEAAERWAKVLGADEDGPPYGRGGGRPGVPSDDKPDGKGPRGEGPKTGLGKGPCSKDVADWKA
jgi:hypothetical protein